MGEGVEGKGAGRVGCTRGRHYRIPGPPHLSWIVGTRTGMTRGMAAPRRLVPEDTRLIISTSYPTTPTHDSAGLPRPLHSRPVTTSS